MPFFKINTYGKAKEVKPLDFPREAYLQTFIEDNLQTIFGLTFVARRKFIEGIQPDTIAFDEREKAFVIIEYKLSDQASAIDQGAKYYALLRKREAEFLLLLPESLRTKYDRKDIYSENSRVIFVKKSYTAAQLSALEFTYPFEFWRYTYYGEMMLLEQIEPPRTQVAPPARTRTLRRAAKELQAYSVEAHAAKIKDRAAREAFDELRQYILNLDTRVIETPKKWFIGYSAGRKFAEIVPQAKAFLLYLNLKISDFEPPDTPVLAKAAEALKLEDCSHLGRWATGNVRVKLTNKDEALKSTSLIDYSFRVNSR
jgi:predicted transport protein